MEPRYDIYSSLHEVPYYWALPDPPAGYAAAVRVYNNAVNIVYIHDVYFTVQGIK